MPERSGTGPGDDGAREREELDLAAVRAEHGHAAEHLLPPQQATLDKVYSSANRVLQDPRATCNRATDFALGDGMFISLMYEEPNEFREESWLIAFGRTDEGSENPTLVADFYPPGFDPEDPNAGKPVGGEVYDRVLLRQMVERAQAQKLPHPLLNALQAFAQVDDEPAELAQVAEGVLELGRNIPRAQATRVVRELQNHTLEDGSSVTIMMIEIQDQEGARKQFTLEQTSDSGRFAKFELEDGRPPLFADIQGMSDEELEELTDDEREEESERRHELLLLEIAHGMQEATEEQARVALEILEAMDAAA